MKKHSRERRGPRTQSRLFRKVFECMVHSWWVCPMPYVAIGRKDEGDRSRNTEETPTPRGLDRSKIYRQVYVHCYSHVNHTLSPPPFNRVGGAQRKRSEELDCNFMLSGICSGPIKFEYSFLTVLSQRDQRSLLCMMTEVFNRAMA